VVSFPDTIGGIILNEEAFLVHSLDSYFVHLKDQQTFSKTKTKKNFKRHFNIPF